MTSTAARIRGAPKRLRGVVQEFLRYGVIGSLAFVVDVGTFNFLQYAGGSGPLHGRPLLAKILSVVLATTVAYFGNRHWTFGHRPRSGFRREYMLFFFFSGIGLSIALGCLWMSHYVIGLTGALADNIAANVVGLAFGASFRFWSYRRYVFPALLAPHPVDQPQTETSR